MHCEVIPALKKNQGRILLVDNDPRSSYIVSLILKLNGYHVDYYADSKSMLSKLQSGAYDLIMLTLESIKTNYLELYSKIRKKDADVKICFMMDSSWNINHDFGENFMQAFGKDLTSCDFVFKPVNSSEILQIVMSHLELRHK